MKTRTAVVRRAPGEWEVVELDLDDPGPGEVQVKVAASGLCHSDDHLTTGDTPLWITPFAGGHEGAGVVTALGAGVTGLAEGDHVVFSFLPACGRCRWCATGYQNLCDRGGGAMAGGRIDAPGSYRMSLDGVPVGQMCGISTFSEYTTAHAMSVVKVPQHLPLDVICLTGCSVGTGWGSAVNAGEVRPGHTVVVMGVGGIGINAVQGARHAGATTVIAVDPVAFKRETALQLGATHAVATMAEATELARQDTQGQGADSAVVSVGVTRPEHVAEAVAAIRKAGTVVVTGLGNAMTVGVPISLGELVLYNKRIQGALFGQSQPTFDIPRQLEMYERGTLKLDELVTTRYSLDQINEAYADMHAGRNIRGVITF